MIETPTQERIAVRQTNTDKREIPRVTHGLEEAVDVLLMHLVEKSQLPKFSPFAKAKGIFNKKNKVKTQISEVFIFIFPPPE